MMILQRVEQVFLAFSAQMKENHVSELASLADLAAAAAASSALAAGVIDLELEGAYSHM